MPIKDLEKLTKFLLEKGGARRAAVFLSTKHPEEVAEVIERLGDRGFEVLRHLPVELQSDVLIRLDEELIREFLSRLSHMDIAQLAGEMEIGDAVDILEELPDEERERVYSQMGEDAAGLRELHDYGEDTASRLISEEFVALGPTSTTAQALRALRDLEEEDVPEIYVVDEGGKLLGRVSLVDLASSPPDTPLSRLMEAPEVVIEPGTDREEVARLFEKHDLYQAPVVDERGKLLGVITVDDVLEVMEKEAGEDILRLGGLGEEEGPLTPPWRAARNRLPWVMLNLLTASLGSAVVASFRGVIDQYAILPAFMPLVAGMGGNAGSQTLAVVIRGLATGEISPGELAKVISRKLLTGLWVGVLAGGVVGVLASFMGGSPGVGSVVTLALVANIMVGCSAGVLVPMSLKKLGLDPALGSGIIITGLTDTLGYALLFGLTLVAMRLGTFG